MKSVVIDGVKSFKVVDAKEVEASKDDVKIDVTYAGICGSDIHYWEAGEPKGLVMGHEFSGVVTNPGARKDIKVGDRVTALPISPCGNCPACQSGNPQYCRSTWTYAVGLSLTNPGAYAPKVFVRPDMVYKIPDNVTDKQAALTEPLAVSLHAVHLAEVKVGSKVLVIGAGIIGLAAAMFAKKQGASLVVVSEANIARGEKAVKLGVADKYINALDPNFAQNAVIESGGNGFDIVIECCGNSAAVNSAVFATKPGGTIVLVGVSLTPINFYSTVAVMAEQKVLGAIAYTKEEFAECLNLMSKKLIDVDKFISKVVPLEEVQASFEELTSGKSDAVKILVDPKL